MLIKCGSVIHPWDIVGHFYKRVKFSRQLPHVCVRVITKWNTTHLIVLLVPLPVKYQKWNISEQGQGEAHFIAHIERLMAQFQVWPLTSLFSLWCRLIAFFSASYSRSVFAQLKCARICLNKYTQRWMYIKDTQLVEDVYICSAELKYKHIRESGWWPVEIIGGSFIFTERFSYTQNNWFPSMLSGRAGHRWDSGFSNWWTEIKCKVFSWLGLFKSLEKRQKARLRLVYWLKRLRKINDLIHDNTRWMDFIEVWMRAIFIFST